MFEPYKLDKLASIIWEHSVIGLAFVDRTGKWLKVNPVLCELLEYTESELLKMTFQQVTHPEDVLDDIEMTQKVLRGEISWYPMTKRYITKSGKVIWIKLVVNAVQNETHDDSVFFFSQIVPIIPINHEHKLVETNKMNSILTIKSIGVFLKHNWFWLSSVGGLFSVVIYWLFQFFMKIHIFMQTHS